MTLALGSPEDDSSFILLHNLHQHFKMMMMKIGRTKMMMMTMAKMTTIKIPKIKVFFTLRQTQREKGRVSSTISIDIEVST